MDSAGWANFQVGTMWSYVGGSIDARKKMLTCPAENWENTTWNNSRNFSYSANWRLVCWKSYDSTEQDKAAADCGYPTMRLAQIPHPAQRIMFLDERQPNDGYFVWPNDNDDRGSTRHFGKGNYMCFDGHAVQLVPDDLWSTSAPVNLDVWN